MHVCYTPVRRLSHFVTSLSFCVLGRYPNRDDNADHSLFEEVDAESAQMAAIKYQEQRVHEFFDSRTKRRQLEGKLRKAAAKQARVEWISAPTARPGRPLAPVNAVHVVDSRIADSIPLPSSASKRESAYSVEFDEEFNEISFALRRFPQETCLATLLKEYLRTSPELRMKQLKRYLAKKIGFESPDVIVLGTSDDPYSGAGLQLVADEWSLFDLHRNSPSFKKSKMLFYKLDS